MVTPCHVCKFASLQICNLHTTHSGGGRFLPEHAGLLCSWPVPAVHYCSWNVDRETLLVYL